MKQTHYAIQRQSDGAWWLFDNRWTPNPMAARRFAFMTTASIQFLRECGDNVPDEWSTQPVEGA